VAGKPNGFDAALFGKLAQRAQVVRERRVAMFKDEAKRVVRRLDGQFRVSGDLVARSVKLDDSMEKVVRLLNFKFTFH
jgi:hypothetical protein